MNPERHYATMADGSQIYYEKSGQGYPLFLLHGNGGSGKYFSRQVPELEKNFQVFLVDSRGHGQSTNNADSLTFAEMAEDIKTIMHLEQIQIADFLGFSDGANLAMVFSSKYPESVHRLILNAGNTTTNGVRLTFQLASYVQYIFLWMLSLFWPQAKRTLISLSLVLHDIGIQEKDLQQISSPTLILVGKHDIIKLKHSIYLAKAIPKASFVLVPGQGHSFARKNPKRFNHEILKFLTE
ncbi:alpha/beta hydrolase [Enterococcus sp. JM4C]|uniref:alpha/beta fold hydrolase n=1 Tax=Candidatus Enterococcus huntleyi TaxID=1857217 RepID=UPI0013798563|nr:alpha/beta hydrolase [Enterococcus sp. JM4C]KAF1298108.1 alpha/beta hydrolase [Enterococcus sp. JM4C]